MDQAREAWTQVTAIFAASPELSVLGFSMGLAIALAVVVYGLSALLSVLNGMRRTTSIAKIKGQGEVGARVVIARSGGGRKGRVARFLRKSAQNYLQDYMFGGPFVVLSHPGGFQSEEQAAAFLRKSEADLVLWAETPRGTRRGMVHLLSAPSRPNEPQPVASRLAMPKRKSDWTETLERATAYAAAKQFRPALGRPQDFRAERLQPVVESLLSIRQSPPLADLALLADISDDATAGALQLAQAGRSEWIPKAEQIARETMSRLDRTQSPDRWIKAKIALGRALRLRAEQKFDPLVLREAVTHLQEAMEALRGEPRLKLAESAAQAISDSQRMLNGQRKFSITGGSV